MLKHFWLGIALFLSCHKLEAQSLLDQKISCSFNDITLSDALDHLSDIADFDYSYRTGVLQSTKKVSIQSQDESLREVLDQLIDDAAIRYKVIGSQIIFVQLETVVVRRTHNVLKGFVRDANTGEPLASAFIVDSTLRLAAETDQRGYYELIVPNPDYELGIYCIADHYEPKELQVQLSSDQELNVKLEVEEIYKDIEPIRFKKEPVFTQVEQRAMVKLVLPKDSISKKNWLSNLTLDNATTLRYKDVRVGLLPILSTNLLQDATSINQLSLNLLVGYSGGTDGVEVGGFMNINRFNMDGIQISGFGNNVGGTTEGVQIAGFYNYNGLTTNGVQLAGFLNATTLGFNGFQAAGFMNYNNGEGEGIQSAGFLNINTDKFNGIQAAGFLNVTNQSFNGLQAAGFANHAKGKLTGAQVSGFINYLSGEINGVQAAGFINVSRGQFDGVQASVINIHRGEFNGVQASFIFNRTSILEKGGMFSMINVVDSISSGAAVGFLSFVKNGLHTWEYEIDNRMHHNINFKTGLSTFYNILTIGYNSKEDFYQVGYGMGTMIFLSKKHRDHIDLDLDWKNRISNEAEFQLNQTVRIKPIYSLKLYKSLELYAGGAVAFHYWREDSEAVGTPLENEFYLSYLGGIRF